MEQKVVIDTAWIGQPKPFDPHNMLDAEEAVFITEQDGSPVLLHNGVAYGPAEISEMADFTIYAHNDEREQKEKIATSIRDAGYKVHIIPDHCDCSRCWEVCKETGCTL